MWIPDQEITLKDGSKAVLRCPAPADAASLLNSFQTSISQTPYLLNTPEEASFTVEQERTFIEAILDSESECMLLCLVGGTVAGNCSISRRTNAKLRHRATIGIALMAEFWGLGIGYAMIQTLIHVGKDIGLEQLELEVVESNSRAISLYEKCGFRTVGIVPNGFHLSDGRRCSELKMVLSL